MVRLPEAVDTPLRTALCIVVLPPFLVRYVAKKEVMRIPIFGQALRLAGNVRVVRTRTARDIERIQQGMMRRAREVSVLFVAEGTRSRDGALHEFKKGALIDGLGIEDRTALRDQAYAVVAGLRAIARRRVRSRGHDPGGVD